MIDLSILMTSYKEPILVRQAIKSMYANLKTIGLEYEFIVVAPDEETIESAEETLNDQKKIYVQRVACVCTKLMVALHLDRRF